MKRIRYGTSKDITEFRQLWDLSFTDSIGFREWFFQNRFIPEYSVCMEEDDKIVSAVQSIPYFLKIRDAILPATMMVGACTHPEYKRRGYMKELYTWYMRYMKSMGVIVCAHTPAVLETYFYVGHFPVSDSAFIEIEKAAPVTVNGVAAIDLEKETAALLKCYLQVAENYSGIIYRTFSDMRLKVNDYMADGAQGIALWEGNELKGYGIYYNSEQMLHGEEVVALDSKAQRQIVNELIRLGEGKKVRIKLPPDTNITAEQGSLQRNPRNVLGLASVSRLLKALGKNIEYAIEIEDEVVLENNGIFNFSGEAIQDEKPVFKGSSGVVLQWLVGYRSIAELEKEGVLQVYDKIKTQELDRIFPKQKCHIIDEY